VLRRTKTELYKTRDISAVVQKLNPIIRGWSNYYRSVASKTTFSAMDKQLMIKLTKWARRKHPRQTKEWVLQRYLKKTDMDGRKRKRFGYLEKESWKSIHFFAETGIQRHVKVKLNASPYDGDYLYWMHRGSDITERRASVQKLITRQKGQCGLCGFYFSPMDLIEVDHILAKKLGGKDNYENLRAVHRHCHDQKVENNKIKGRA
jgi:RNA-directed DNA polymerase